MPAFDYRLFGLRIRSELKLPELALGSGAGEPDIVVRVEPPGSAGAAQGEAAGRLTIDDVADYRISDGREIVIRPTPGADPSHLRLFLLGSAMGMALHQRGLLPLHANAIEIDGQAIAFVGASGAGKSTLAAWFHDRNCRIVADDVCVVAVGAEGAVVLPGLPRIRLWREALERSGRSASDHPRSYAGDEEYDKFDVAARDGGVVEGPVPLCAVCLLERGEDFAVDRVVGIEAADLLFAHTYRGEYVALLGQQEAHWRACLRLLDHVRIFRVQRAWGLAEMDTVNGQLRDAFQVMLRGD